MSYPRYINTYKLTDFVIVELSYLFGIEYFFYENCSTEDFGKLYDGGKAAFLNVNVPPFCCEEKTKLGIFLKEFSTFLCEMLVKWDKVVVERFFNEAMQKVFPNEVENYELGFYENLNKPYCTIQFTAKKYKEIFKSDRKETYAEELSSLLLPPKRTLFQEKDEDWEKARIRQIEAKALRRLRHPRRATALRDYIESDGNSENKKHKEE